MPLESLRATEPPKNKAQKKKSLGYRVAVVMEMCAPQTQWAGRGLAGEDILDGRLMNSQDKGRALNLQRLA